MTHHGAGLRQLTKDDALVEALSTDYRTAPLTAADRAMLDYAVKLALEPWTMKEDDVEALRRAGFDDSAVLDVAQVASYYSYVNRMALGLGVELEGYWGEG